jgi:uncharacterized protein YraI
MKTIAAALAAAAVCAGFAATEPLKATATLNCRNTPSSYGTVVASIANGDVVEGEAAAGEWTKVDGDPACWAASRYLAPQGKAVPAAAGARYRSSPLKSYRISKPRRLSASSSALASRRSAPKGPIFSPRSFGSSGCPCDGSRVCIGPRGGRYCITSGGNKRYGV